MTFGEKLQTLRKARGLSQEQLAAQMTVSRQAVSKWELGESNPDMENLVQISTIFNVTTDYLLKGDELQGDEPPGNAGRTALPRHPNASAAQALLLASTAFLAIGLLCAFGGWDAQKPGEAVFGGMLIQVVGIVSYFIARALHPIKAPFAINFANWAIVLFIPISLLSALLLSRTIAPYPRDLQTGAVFTAVYLTALVLGYFRLKAKKAN